MIKLKEILTENVPNVLYHATFLALLPEIKMKGLLPDGEIHNFDNIERGVYLGVTHEYAGSMVEASENDDIPEKWFGEIIVIAINTNKLDQSKLDIDPNVAPQEDEYDDTIPADETVYSYIYRGIIPTSAFISITDYD